MKFCYFLIYLTVHFFIAKYNKAIEDCSKVLEYLEIFEGGFEKSKATAFKAFLRRSLAHKLKSSLPQAEQDVKQALILEPTSSEAINLEKEIKALTEYGGVKKVFLEDFERKMGGKKKLIDEFLSKIEKSTDDMKPNTLVCEKKEGDDGKRRKVDVESKKNENEDVKTLKDVKKEENDLLVDEKKEGEDGKREKTNVESKQDEDVKTLKGGKVAKKKVQEIREKEEQMDAEDDEETDHSRKIHLGELAGEVARLLGKHKEAKSYFREKGGLLKILRLFESETNDEISKILQQLLSLLGNYLSEDVIAIEEFITQNGLQTLTKRLKNCLSSALQHPIYYDHIIALTEVLITLTMQEKVRVLLSLEATIKEILEQTLTQFSIKEPHAFSNLSLLLGNLCYQASAFKTHIVSTKLHSFLTLLKIFPLGPQRKVLLLQESYFNWLANVLTGEGVIDEFFGKGGYLEELGRGLPKVGKQVESNASFCEATLSVVANLSFRLGKEREEKFGWFFERVLDFAVLIAQNADHRNENNKTLISRSLTILSRLTLLPPPSSPPPPPSYTSFLKANFTTIKFLDQLGWKEGYANNGLRVVGKLFTGERQRVVELGLKPEKELMVSLMVNLSSEDEMRFCNR